MIYTNITRKILFVWARWFPKVKDRFQNFLHNNIYKILTKNIRNWNQSFLWQTKKLHLESFSMYDIRTGFLSRADICNLTMNMTVQSMQERKRDRKKIKKEISWSSFSDSFILFFLLLNRSYDVINKEHNLFCRIHEDLVFSNEFSENKKWISLNNYKQNFTFDIIWRWKFIEIEGNLVWKVYWLALYTHSTKNMKHLSSISK